jgi:glycosyltransferase involved in cell wall biosynthesis
MEIGIVSVFPAEGQKHVSSGGIEGYTNNMVQELSKFSVVTIFAEKKDSLKSNYQESAVRVIRCWEKGILYPFQIWLSSLRYKTDIFHIHHEYYLYGGILSAMIFPLLVLFLRSRAPVVITFHGVISYKYLDELELYELPFFLKRLIMAVLKVNLRQISCLCNKIIVHNDYLKEVIEKEYGVKTSKVLVLRHGIELNTTMDSGEARNILNISASKVILFFGYLSKRKGLEQLIEAFVKVKDDLPNTLLIIGAGNNPRLSNKVEYTEYYNYIQTKAKEVDIIRFVGFIPETKLKIYISAADVIVFPYSIPISASGPLSISLGFNKLVLCSDIPTFKEIIKTDKLLFRAGSSEELYRKLKYILSLSADQNSSLLKLIAEIKNDLSWYNISLQTLGTYTTLLEKINN